MLLGEKSDISQMTMYLFLPKELATWGDLVRGPWQTKPRFLCKKGVATPLQETLSANTLQLFTFTVSFNCKQPPRWGPAHPWAAHMQWWLGGRAGRGWRPDHFSPMWGLWWAELTPRLPAMVQRLHSASTLLLSRMLISRKDHVPQTLSQHQLQKKSSSDKGYMNKKRLAVLGFISFRNHLGEGGGGRQERRHVLSILWDNWIWKDTVTIGRKGARAELVQLRANSALKPVSWSWTCGQVLSPQQSPGDQGPAQTITRWGQRCQMKQGHRADSLKGRESKRTSS